MLRFPHLETFIFHQLLRFPLEFVFTIFCLKYSWIWLFSNWATNLGWHPSASLPTPSSQCQGDFRISFQSLCPCKKIYLTKPEPSNGKLASWSSPTVPGHHRTRLWSARHWPERQLPDNILRSVRPSCLVPPHQTNTQPAQPRYCPTSNFARSLWCGDCR